MKPSIFKAYDIRGVYPEEMNEEIAEKIARAMVVYLGDTSAPLVVGRDCRLSSPTVAEAVIKGTRAQGRDVLDIGMVSTDLFYFACATEKLPGIMVTASHNPKEYNGLKLTKEIPWMIGGGQGMEEIEALVHRGEFSTAPREGLVQKKYFLPAFREKVLSFIDPTSIKPLTIVMDAGNGMAGVLLQEILKDLPIKIIPLFFEPDGSFPNHGPNPLLSENRIALEAAVRQYGADAGFAFDADVDRFFVVDDTGAFVSGDFLTGLLGEEFVQRYSGASIIYCVRASWMVRDRVSALGGHPLINRVGNTYFKKRMEETNAVFGGEFAGHYFFRDFFKVDTGIVAALMMISYLSRQSQKLSSIMSEIRATYHISGEINSTVTDVPAIYARLKEKYSTGAVSELDGLSIDYPDWHFNVRPSNTEPLLRLNLEAKSKEQMEQKRDEVLAIIRSLSL